MRHDIDPYAVRRWRTLGQPVVLKAQVSWTYPPYACLCVDDASDDEQRTFSWAGTWDATRHPLSAFL